MLHVGSRKCLGAAEEAGEERDEGAGSCSRCSALTCTGIKCMLAECKQIYRFNIPLLSRLKRNIFKWNEEWGRQSIFLSDV